MQTYEQGQVCYLTGEHGEAVKHVYLGSQWVPMSAELESVINAALWHPAIGAIAFAAKLIAAHDARLLDEAAERVRLAILAAVRKHEDQMLGKWHSKEYTDGLSCGMDISIAAIKGAAHE